MKITPFSIIIPVYNEQDNILNLYNEINKSFYDNQINLYEIIFVDDCSIDNSNKIIKTLLDKDKKIKLLSNDLNYGQSYSITKGIKNSSNNIIVTIDGDGQNNPFDILKLLKFYNNSQFKLIGGLRNKRKDPFIKIISSKLANKIRSFILKDNCTDTGCGLKIFDKEIFMSFEYFNGIHRFLPALFLGYGHKTFFIEVDHRERKYGVSKYGTLKRLFSGILNIARVKRMLGGIKKYKN
mgnify:CR=1 FL=1